MFKDRKEAGTLLAQKLKEVVLDNALVFGITRGGIVVAYQVSRLLSLPLLPIIVKKIGAPSNPELALGAVTYNNVYFLDKELSKRLDVSSGYLKNELNQKGKQVELLKKQLGIKKLIRLKGKTVIVIDDGIATGATVKAVVTYLKKKQAQKIIIAVPVIATDTYRQLKSELNIIIALKIANYFNAVGEFYESFPQVSNEDVVKFLKSSQNL